MPDIERYTALALQSRCDAINKLNKADARQAMQAAIARIDKEIRGSMLLTGPDLRLVVLPEYFMTAYPVGENIDDWAAKAGIAPGGAEYDALGAIAQKYKIWLSGNAYETDDNFPGYYFQVSFIIEPSGNVILRYHRLISMFAPTPHDVWDRFLELYGIDAVFPVVETDIGKLACCASEEILFPEITRAHALRGAEIILHSSSEVASPSATPKEIARRARAIENGVYVISANSAGVHGEDIPAASVDGKSTIIDYKGHVLVNADTGETMAAHAMIDLPALRANRRRPGMPNYFARQRLELFAEAYSGSVYAANSLTKSLARGEVPGREHFIDMQRETIQKLADKKLI